ncbi:MAG: cob(I)yrinic acid a,c-diamide adenosyltransferase [Candidatus Aenigmarchaeota archaeon]|nr:cob(I)yrinic acid a,c-diamide adenosyltransferase [Candidatus Aenigmarchaeota archaeon]
MKVFRDSHKTLTVKGMKEKTSLRVEALGTVDELDAFVGAARACCTDGNIRKELKGVQQDLRSLLAELAGAARVITANDVSKLDTLIEKTEKPLPPLRNFILTWNSPEASSLNVCRAVARRAERRLLALKKKEPVNEQAFRYLNRLSDVFFAMARLADKNAGFAGEKWNGRSEKL